MVHRLIYGIFCLLLVLTLGREAWKEEDPSPHALVEAPYAHAQRLDGEGISVAVIDEGFDPEHSVLKNNLISAHYNRDHTLRSVYEPVFFGTKGYEFENHGTHVTGIILGLAPKVQIIPIQLGEFGGDQIFVKALQSAALSHADVVNISMRLNRTGREISPNVRQALINLATSGKIIVIAAGNDNSPLMKYAYTKSLVDLSNDPSMEGRLLLVGASACKNKIETLASFSNFPGRRTLRAQTNFITAPGVDIVSAITGGDFGKKSGTSMAAPMVVGALCLLRQAFPHLSAEGLADLVLTSARTTSITGEPLSHARFGAGIVNLKLALEKGHRS